MKKGLIIPALLLTIGFVSCKKDYTCTCTSSVSGSTPSVKKIIGVSKKTAQANCASYTETDTGGTDTETCTLS
ncbi:MAG: hypothetical protein ACXVP0_09285 [Bacteroidia bacterium]